MAMRMPLPVSRIGIIAILLFGVSNRIVGVLASASLDIATRNLSFDVSSTMATNFPFKKNRCRLSDFRLKSHHSIPNRDISLESNNMHHRKLALDTIFTHRAGAESTKLHYLSTVLFILNQTINSITAVVVGSGFLGSWIASFIICKLHKLASSTTLNKAATAAARGSRGPLLSVFKRKWTLTILSCGVYFILNCHKIIRAVCTRNAFDSLMGFGDIGTLLVFCLFSSTVDPVLGGLIGSSYVSLDMIAYLLGSRDIVNPISQLMKFRMKPLVDGTEFVGDDNAIPPKVLPIRESLANAILSMPLLASRAQYFMSLYLLASTIVTWMAKSEHTWCRDFVSWLKVEWMSSVNVESTGDGLFGPWTLSSRLYALNFIVMTIKAVMAFILL